MADTGHASLPQAQVSLEKSSLDRLFVFSPFSRVLPSHIAPLMKRCTGGSRVVDVLLHMPTHGVIRQRIATLEEARILPQGTQIILPVTVRAHIPPPSLRSPYKIQVVDTQEEWLELIFFHANSGYLRKRYPIDGQKILSGVLNTESSPWSIIHPDCLNTMPCFDKNWMLFEPIYPLTAGLTNRMFTQYCHRLLALTPPLEEWLPSEFLKSKEWPTWKAALVDIHKASNPEALHPNTKARQRLFFDELLAHQLVVQIRRAKRKEKPGRTFPHGTTLRKKLLQALPFVLTKDQEDALKEIDQDLSRPCAMGRLLQGDVGTGKTLVALMAMVRVIEAGAQVAVLAPTEVLARQHYETFNKYLMACHEVKIALLVGRLSARTRREQSRLLQEIATGSVHLVVGTHALLESKVQFHDLGFVVIDEQHRFGVRQRLELVRKGIHCASLYLSATPIPRTLLLTEYGDLSVSYMREKPAGRQPVITRIQRLSMIEDVIERLYDRLQSQEEQAFWICPLVEISEKLDLMAAEERFVHLKTRFGERVGLLHGRLSSQEKETVLKAFRSRHLSLLVATTVIEVGIDIPAATIMIIEHAERFGLAQLHQLRGRIGRGTKPAFCLLLHASPLSPMAYQRLRAFKTTADGLELAEMDLKLRGGGDVAGVKQSGFHVFKLGDVLENYALLKEAHEMAKTLLAKNLMFYIDSNDPKMALLKLFGKDAELDYRAQ
ncbi:MAG: ATP-dependent DNA helicase RecG [Holosporales bacterium]|jgi:ATP-dependent DNA helicase RecG|nr:ATP-dependent DNA helicase RecG [Holosporales bacterium]